MQSEQGERAGIEVVLQSAFQESHRLFVPIGDGRVQHRLPPHAGLVRRQGKRPRLVVRIEQHQERVVQDRSSLRVLLLDRVARQPDAQAADIPLGPVLIRHLFAIRAKPGDVLDLRATDAAALKKAAAPEHGMVLSQLDQASCKGHERLLMFAQVPIDPADLIVLAIGVVVAVLRPAHFVAAADHRHALGQEQGGQQVALLPLPEHR